MLSDFPASIPQFPTDMIHPKVRVFHKNVVILKAAFFTSGPKDLPLHRPIAQARPASRK
jgi:hypothetical protein